MEFNKNQKKVIETIDKNIFLMAPAGTGKTTVLAERICNILKNGANPKEILCITFTNKACVELKERIEDRVGKDALNITVKTFHSFCLQIVKEFSKKKTDLFYDFLVFDEYDSKEILKKINKYNINGKLLDLDVNRLYNAIQFVKEKRLDFERFTESSEEDIAYTVDKIFNTKEYFLKLQECLKYKEGRDYVVDINILEFLKGKKGRVVYFYNSMLENSRGVDFIDLLSKAYVLFKDEKIVESYKKRYRYICVDEMQDTGITEYKIIRKIFKDNNILLCGDTFQTIYSFRGSDPKKILEDFKKFNPVEIALNENYRSTQKINDLSIGYLKNSFEERFNEIYKEGLESFSKEEGEKIQIISSENNFKESEIIYNKCKEFKERGLDLNKTCILTRSNSINKDISSVVSKLEGNDGFRFILVDEYRFFRRSEIKDVISFLKVLVNESDTVSLERVLKNLNTGITAETIREILEDNNHRKERVKINDYISEMTEYGEYYRLLIDEFKRDNIVVFDVESTGVDVTEDEIIQIAAIKINSKGEVISKFEEFIKPKKSVGKSEYVHGFSDEFLKRKGREKSEVFLEFLKYIEGSVVVGHNVNYDISIFSSELTRLKMPPILVKGVYDTLEIYRRFYPTLKNHKLEFLSNEFNTKSKPSHNAMDDIKATGEILVMAINSKIEPRTREREVLIGKHFRKFKAFREKLRKIREASYRLRGYELIELLEGEFNFTAGAIEKKISKKENIDKLKEIVKVLDNKEKSPRDSLLEIIGITGLSNGDLEELLVEKTGEVRIPIITIHQAKGLEFENVIIAGMQEGAFPIAKADYEEEKRLFYVALTRAKKNLVITYSIKNKWGRESGKSRLIGLLPRL